MAQPTSTSLIRAETRTGGCKKIVVKTAIQVQAFLNAAVARKETVMAAVNTAFL